MEKKVLVGLAISSLGVTATAAFAGLHAGTGLNGSAHDLNVTGYNQDSFQRTCAFCHTPHNAQTAAAAETPLWNHVDIGIGATAPRVFTAYAWVAPANQNQDFSTISDPLAGPSRLCMACHDGVTAADAHGAAGGSGTADGHPITATYTDALNNTVKRYIDDLQTTHPIGFDYDAAASTRGSSEIVPSTHGFIVGAAPVGVGAAEFNTKSRNFQETTKKISDVLYKGIMTCASCHDVHNTLNVSDSAHSYNYFLYAEQAGSAICLSCHVK